MRRRMAPSRWEAAQGSFTVGGSAGHLAKGRRVGHCFDGWSVLSHV
jgi:hypothetical protein